MIHRKLDKKMSIKIMAATQHNNNNVGIITIQKALKDWVKIIITPP